MKVIDGGVTAAKGFEAAGAEAAIKYQNRKDMAMVYSKVPCKAAGTFTTNVVKAAPVLWDRDIVANSEYAQAVVVNAGIANACTGKQGLDYCRREAEVTGRLLGIPAEAVLVGSTGVIGMQLPMDRIEAGIAKLVEAKSDTLEAGHTAACSIMTTDTISKEIAVSFELDGKDNYGRWYEQGLRYDSSQYVYHACIYHHRYGNLQRTPSGSAQYKCSRYL